MHYLWIRVVNNQLDQAVFDAFELLQRIKVTSPDAYPLTPQIAPIMMEAKAAMFGAKPQMSFYILLLVHSVKGFKDANGEPINDGQVIMPQKEIDSVKKFQA